MWETYGIDVWYLTSNGSSLLVWSNFPHGSNFAPIWDLFFMFCIKWKHLKKQNLSDTARYRCLVNGMYDRMVTFYQVFSNHGPWVASLWLLLDFLIRISRNCKHLFLWNRNVERLCILPCPVGYLFSLHVYSANVK